MLIEKRIDLPLSSGAEAVQRMRGGSALREGGTALLLLFALLCSGITWSSASAGASAQVGQGDLWQRMRNGFQLQAIDHPQITEAESWILAQPDLFEALQRRARPYLYFIVGEVAARGLPLELALLPAIESGFKPFAESPRGARGLWQFIAPTAQDRGLSEDWWYDERRDPITSTHAALGYLTALARRFEGDWTLALAAYNGGQRRVATALRRGDEESDLWSLQLPQETLDYVPRLLALARIIADPERYGVTLPPLPNRPYFTPFTIRDEIDLSIVAEMAEISEYELVLLNPGFKRRITLFDGELRLLIPNHALTPFQRALQQRGSVASIHPAAAVPYTARGGLQRKLALIGEQGRGVQIHRVRAGESLAEVAERYQIEVEQLQRWNGLDPEGVLWVGQELVVLG